MKITFLDKIYKVDYDLKSIDMNKVVEIIRKGDIIVTNPDTGKSMNLREATEITHRTCDLPERQEIKKRLLPAVTFNGEFSKVDKLHCTSYSGITALDIDHISTQQEYYEIYKKLLSIPYTAMIYQTPSGRGLKVIVKHDNTDPSKHESLYRQLIKVYDIPHIDCGCSDLARRNYICYDPNVCINCKAIPFHYIPSSVQTTARVNTNSGMARNVSEKSIVAIMNKKWHERHPEYWMEGNRANSIFMLACMMCKWGVSLDMATDYFIREWEGETMKRSEIESHVKNAYKVEHLNYGTVEFVRYK